MGANCDIVFENYAMEKGFLCTLKKISAKGGAVAPLPISMTRGYLSRGMEKLESAARKIISAVADGDMLRTQLAILRRLSKHELFNTVELRREIARKVIDRGRYSLS